MKKFILALGSVAAIATPVVAVVSCGKKAEAAKTTQTTQTTSNNHQAQNAGRVQGLVTALRTGNKISEELQKAVQLRNITTEEVKTILTEAKASTHVPSLFKFILKDTDSAISMWKKILNQGTAALAYDAFKELSIKGLKAMTTRMSIPNLNHTHGNALTAAEREAVVAFYKAKHNKDVEVDNAFNTVVNTTDVPSSEVTPMHTSAEWQALGNEAWQSGIFEMWIKNHMTEAQLEEIMDKLPSEFIRFFRPVISGILESLDLKVGSRQVTFSKEASASDAALLVNVINDAWTHPLSYRGNTSLYAVSRLDELQLFTNNSPMIKSIVELVQLLTMSANNATGIAGAITSGTPAESTTLVNSILSIFLKKEVPAGSPTGTVSAFDKTAPLIRGLLLGFHSSKELETALTNLAPSLGNNISLIGTSIAGAFSQLQENDHLSGGVLSSAGLLFDKRFMPGLHNLFTKGLVGMTKAEIEDLLRGVQASAANDAVQGLLGSQLDSFKINNMSVLNWLQSLLTEHAILSVTNGIYDILHSPLQDIKAESFNALIELINNTGLMKTKLPLIGEAIHTLIHDSPSAVNAGQLASVLSIIKLDDASKDLIMSAALGSNYEAIGKANVRTQTASLTLPQEQALVQGAAPTGFTMKYADLQTRFNALRAEVASTTSSLTLAQLYNKYAEMQTIITKVNELNVASTANNATYNTEFKKANDAAQAVIKTLPAKVELQDSTKASLLGDDSWTKVQTEWNAAIAKVHAGATVRSVRGATTELEELVTRAKALNKKIAFINKYHSLDVTPENIGEALEMYALNVVADSDWITGAKYKAYYISTDALNALGAHGMRVFIDGKLNVGAIVSAHGAHFEGKTEMEHADFMTAFAAFGNPTLKVRLDEGTTVFHL